MKNKNVLDVWDSVRRWGVNSFNNIFSKNLFLKMVGLFLVSVIILIVIPLWPDFLKGVVLRHKEQKIKLTQPNPTPSTLGVMTDPLEQSFVDNRCGGAFFEILGRYLSPVGGERLQAEDLGYSARGTTNYQATQETKWGCSLPFTAQIVAIPVSGESFGLSFEYLGMFKIVLGDGDRKSIRVEQNKWNNRKIPWQIVPTFDGKERAVLVNSIENNEEVTLNIKARHENDEIFLYIKILHSKLGSNEEFIYHFSPNGKNFQSDQQRKFRVGINDSRFKGEGSVVDLQTISIKEGEW